MKTDTADTTLAEMADTLKAAGKKAVIENAARREHQVKGSHLLETLKNKAVAAGLTIVDQTSFLKITGTSKSKRVYVAKKGGRVDLNGFTVESPAVRQMSEEEAKEKHLGNVRGQLDFEQPDGLVLEAYDAALAVLLAPAPEVQAPKAQAPVPEVQVVGPVEV
jgi:hypothetical protein